MEKRIIVEKLRKVSRFRERQYQLAAQKHNEAFLKHNYYQQTADYFERTCRIAKHYDSWNYKSLDPKGELEKAKKAERLLTRRNKLRNLLREEEESYRREIDERKRLTPKPEESSLEKLRQKLKEKKAEQSLYYPQTCRRYQSYFASPKDSNSPRWNTLRNTNLQYTRVCRDSPNTFNRSGQSSYRRNYKMSVYDNSSKEQNDRDARLEMSGSPLSQYMDEHVTPNSKYSARYARQSLEHTNVRTEDVVDHEVDRPPSRASVSPDSGMGRYPSPTEDPPVYGDNKNEKRAQQVNSYQEVRAAGMPSEGTAGGHIVIPWRENVGQRNERDEHLENSSVAWSRENSEARKAEEEEKISARQEQQKLDRYNATETKNAKDTKKKDQRQFEVEKTMPWLRMDPGIKNLSKQMFMYLTHNELKTKIDDLAKREQHACNKHCWDEALRLRDMRNRVELICEKQLYNIEDFELDEDVKKVGLYNIGKREAELAQRENVCTDTTLYSQDAKDMWQKWVHEDDNSAIKDAKQLRETLMDSLEKEWQDLAIREKEKITREYHNVLQHSDVQEEHKLSANIHAAGLKSSHSNSFK
ncbi:uncharacterized protein LOC128887481 isoform X1 [Hylaeus anthracinus]|uniref:uncharacterized protein LOC128887481 isoform X1 n=1 Tax=Hylaeus anthracinus TaxID=313031 RepID=UPI0023B8D1F6|nr:uncharacterized protein LOC128887481 isoform X1 [Hylaeus anthracinus]